MLKQVFLNTFSFFFRGGGGVMFLVYIDIYNSF